MRRIIRLVCVLAFVALSSAAVEAQVQKCAPHEDVIKALIGKYQERQRAIGLINEKAMMEVYISTEGSWTVLVTNEMGVTCVLAAGEAWDEIPAPVAGLGS